LIIWEYARPLQVFFPHYKTNIVKAHSLNQQTNTTQPHTVFCMIEEKVRPRSLCVVFVPLMIRVLQNISCQKQGLENSSTSHYNPRSTFFFLLLFIHIAGEVPVAKKTRISRKE
jgi:hypothetical protein